MRLKLNYMCDILTISDLRIGNLIKYGSKYMTIEAIKISEFDGYCYVKTKENKDFKHIDMFESISLNEFWLKRLGFKNVPYEYSNNKEEWLMSLSDDYIDDGDVINRNRNWFSGIGTIDYKTDGSLSVSFMCKGNFVVSGISTVHAIQNIYYTITLNELSISENDS